MLSNSRSRSEPCLVTENAIGNCMRRHSATSLKTNSAAQTLDLVRSLDKVLPDTFIWALLVQLLLLAVRYGSCHLLP